MKRLFTLLSLCACISWVCAETRTISEMQDIALTVLNKKNIHRTPSTSPSSHKPAILLETEQIALVGYETGGFVAIATDKSNEAVLGHSDAEVSDTLPEGLVWWLEAMDDALSHGNATRKHTPAANQPDIIPLIKTKWNQYEPYNNLLHYTINGKEYVFVTGCVATAMAQVMKYYEYPAKGTGSNTYSINYTDIGLFTYSSNFSEHTYDWDNMLDNYYGEEPDIEQQAVAQLVYDCGVAVNMSYTSSGSGANTAKIVPACTKYFDYSTDAKLIKRNNYTADSWLQLMLTELNNKRPILYSGQTNDKSGHQFILDGYSTSDGFFHVNWGWGGYCDGYYDISLLNPNEDSYSNYQDAIINLTPNGKRPSKGINIDGLYYTLDATTKTAEVVRGEYNSAFYTIPQTVAYDGNTYTVTSIGIGAFQDCTKLSIVTLPNSIKTIRRSAFAGTSLTSITIPQQTQTIESNAFYDCERLGNVTFTGQQIKEIYAGTFAYCTSLTQIDIPEGVVFLYGTSFSGCTALEEVVLPSTFDSFHFNAFTQCPNLQRIAVKANYRLGWNYSYPINFDYSKCILYVTNSSLNSYKWHIENSTNEGNTSVWSFFKDIRSIDEFGKKTYTIEVSSNNDDFGTVTDKSGDYLEGTTIILQATPKEGYKFVQWSDGVTEQSRRLTISGNLSIVAIFEILKFEVRFVDWDNSIIKQDTLEYNTLPTAPADPFRHATAEYTYTFSGWTPQIEPATKQTTYYATYTFTTNEYTITFKDEDGSIIESKYWKYGDMPSCQTPEKPQEGNQIYAFEAWVPEIEKVTGDATYTATYSFYSQFSTITFVDWDGTVLSSGQWKYGFLPYCTAPTRPDDDQYSYTFDSWMPEIVPVKIDATYTATYTVSERTANALNQTPLESKPIKTIDQQGNIIIRMPDGTRYSIIGTQL